MYKSILEEKKTVGKFNIYYSIKCMATCNLNKHFYKLSAAACDAQITVKNVERVNIRTAANNVTTAFVK